MFIMFIKYKTNMKIYWYSEYKIRNKFIIESKYKFSFLEKHVFFFQEFFFIIESVQKFWWVSCKYVWVSILYYRNR